MSTIWSWQHKKWEEKIESRRLSHDQWNGIIFLKVNCDKLMMCIKNARETTEIKPKSYSE